jgi:hypothetical protein
VLRSAGSGDYVLLHPKRLNVGDVIKTASGTWLVTEEEQPTTVGVHARFICTRCECPSGS